MSRVSQNLTKRTKVASWMPSLAPRASFKPSDDVVNKFSLANNNNRYTHYLYPKNVVERPGESSGPCIDVAHAESGRYRKDDR